MTIQDILTGFLGKTLNMPPEAVTSTLYKLDDEGNPTDELNDDALDRLANAHAEHVKALKGADAAKVGEQQYKRGIKEGLSNLEKTLRETHGIESQATGLDLINDIIAAKAKVELDEDKVKIHPLYLKAEREAAAKAEAVRAELEQRIAEIENGYKRKTTLDVVRNKALETLASMRPVLPQNPTVAATQQKLFASMFDSYDYEVGDNGNILVLKDGKRVENDHGHPVPFETLVQQTASQMFEFAKTDPKGNGGNTGKVAGESGGAKSGQFKDEADFKQQYAKADRATQVELVKAWKAQGAAG